MGFAGELTTIGLAEVFQNVAFHRLTGTLTVSEKDRKAVLYIAEGRVRMLALDQPFDYLAVAARSQAAPEEAIEQAGRRRRRRTLKSALKEWEGFDEERYDAGVSAQVAEEVIHLFSWRYASFVFEEGRADDTIFDREQMGCAISLDPLALAMEAARRLDEWETISKHVASDKEIFLQVQEADPAAFSQDQQEVLSLLDGTRDLGSVVQALPHGRFQVMKTVATLVDGGIVTRATGQHLREMAGKAQASGDIARAVRHLEAALEREGGNLEIRTDLVRLYERTGRKMDAAREHKRLAFAQAERGDAKGALESYERAATLVPYDTDTLEKIANLHETQGDRAEFMKAGRRLAEALSAQGLHEDALAIYRRLLKEDEQNISLRESLATVHIKLHEPKKAAAELLSLAKRAYAKGEFDNALHYYRNVIAVDRGCTEASQRIDQIESGRARERRRARRRRILVALFGAFLGLVGWQGAREWQAQQALQSAARATASGLAQNAGDLSIIASMRSYAAICADFRWTFGSAEAEESLRGLLLDELHRLRTAVSVVPEAARSHVQAIEKIPFPQGIRQFWHDSRDRILQQLAQGE